MSCEKISTINAKNLGIKFGDLVDKYPHLSKYLLSKNPPKFDLGNPEILTKINQSLARELVKVDIEVPEKQLIPSVSLRLAYVQSVIDLCDSKNKVIEIGTGSSAIISLILAKKYSREIISTEIGEASYQSAIENVKRNQLENSIILLKSDGSIFENLIPSGNYSFLMCYPPIYSNDLTILDKKRGWRGKKTELIGGGKDGLDFSKKLLDEVLDARNISIEFVTIILMNEEQLKTLSNYVSARRKTGYIEIKAGTRNRYVLVLFPKI